MILSERSAYINGAINELDSLADKLERSGKQLIKMNIGDPSRYFPTPKYIIDAYIDALKKHKTYYSSPQGLYNLRAQVAKKYNNLVSTNDVFITQGISEALMILNSAMINPQDNALIISPYFPPYLPFLKSNGGTPVIFEQDEKNNWSIDTDMLRRYIHDMHLKYMLFATPSNPTGTILSKKVVAELADIANDNDIMIISDEIYDELTYKGKKFTSISSVASDMPYIVLNGASKTLDSTGFRIGYIIANGDKEDMRALKSKIYDYCSLRLSANTPAQYAAYEGMRNVKEHKAAIDLMNSAIQARVKIMANAINRLNVMSVVMPSGAFYLLPKIDFSKLDIKDDYEFSRSLLLEKGVQTVAGSGFGAPGHIRIVVLHEPDVVAQAANRISEFCYEHEK